jgi:hypothetical protein
MSQENIESVNVKISEELVEQENHENQPIVQFESIHKMKDEVVVEEKQEVVVEEKVEVVVEEKVEVVVEEKQEVVVEEKQEVVVEEKQEVVVEEKVEVVVEEKVEVVVEEKLEVVVEEKVEVPSVNPNTLIECLMLIINRTDVEKRTVKINDNLIDILKKIMENTPKIFDEVEENIRNIISDDIINSKDVPDIMMLILNIYELVSNIKTIKMTKQQLANTCASIVKIILHILIEEGIIKVKEENQIPILEQLDRLVDMSMRLVLLSYKAESCGCLGKIFKKK